MEYNSTTTSRLNNLILNQVYEYGRQFVYFSEGIVIIIANILTLIVVIRTKKLRDVPANTFIMSLACADGMIGVLLPAIILTLLTYDQNIWIVSACIFRGPYYAMFSISLSTLLAIAIDRYVAVVHPLIYKMQMTVTIARFTCICIWLLQLALWETLTCYYGLQISVQNDRPAAAHDIFPGISFFFLSQVEILLPVIGNLILYLAIYIKLRRRAAVSVSSTSNQNSSNANQPSAKTKSFTKMMALVLGYLLLAWLPYYIIIPLYKVNNPATPIWYVYMYDVVSIVLYSNSFVNPVIYSWQNRDFREAYAKILKVKTRVRSSADRTTNNRTIVVTSSNM